MTGRNGSGGNDPYAREIARQAREQEKARKAAEAEAKRKAREKKLAYEVARAQEAVDLTYVVENDAEQLSNLLRTAVLHGSPLTFDRLKQQFRPAAFVPPKGKSKAIRQPQWEEYEPEPPRGLLGALGFGRKGYDTEVESAREGSTADLGDRCGHAAWRAGVVMAISYSTGVSRPSEVCRRRRW
ncbi:hypothetical protein [Streptomyces sp. NPDC050264]|uniref:hypothetical protein n=1 Tax=Streptomyces sp. NPDC050264 TaxID=3155038 RepID=UPI003440A794